MNETDLKAASKEEMLCDKKQNLCPICNKVIIGPAYKFNCHLYKHRAIAARYACPHCSKQFYRNDLFKHHISKHTGEYKNLFLCDYCNRTFVDKRNLLKHYKVHDDSFSEHPKVKTYSCHACEITYTEERCLKHHLKRIHSNSEVKEPKYVKKPVNDTWVERVLETKVCVQMTKLDDNVIAIKKCDDKIASNLNTYFEKSREINMSQYSKAICDYCNKEMLKKSLRLHIKERHMTAGTFKCRVCKNSYSRHYQLVNHICGKPRNKNRVKNENKNKNGKRGKCKHV